MESIKEFGEKRMAKMEEEELESLMETTEESQKETTEESLMEIEMFQKLLKTRMKATQWRIVSQVEENR